MAVGYRIQDQEEYEEALKLQQAMLQTLDENDGARWSMYQKLRERIEAYEQAQRQEVEDSREEQEVIVDPRIYVNGFPKSGTHLGEQIVSALALPMNTSNGPWAGCFRDHSWTTHWIADKRVFRQLGFIRDGTYAKGHLGYREDLMHFLWGIGASVIFIYRDLRDVAVSLTNHILNDQTHSHPEWYKDMGFDAALLAVIQGLGPYAGVVDRWEQYAGWLDIDWVYSVKYEDLIANREEKCGEIMEYVLGHAGRFRGYSVEIPPEEYAKGLERMIRRSSRTDLSPTFRKGQPGEWREVFKEGHRAAFRFADENGWLVKLGYEDAADWWQPAEDESSE